MKMWARHIELRETTGMNVRAQGAGRVLQLSGVGEYKIG